MYKIFGCFPNNKSSGYGRKRKDLCHGCKQGKKSPLILIHSIGVSMDGWKNPKLTENRWLYYVLEFGFIKKILINLNHTVYRIPT
jgi:hypothetical protein